MKIEGLIKDYMPGEKIMEIIQNSNDPIKGYDGVIFVFVK